MRMNMRHERKVGAIASFKEDRHESHKTDHRIKILGVQLANDDEEDTRHDTDEVNPELLRPKVVAGPLVEQVTDEATQRARHNVEQAKHGGPSPGSGLAEV